MTISPKRVMAPTRGFSLIEAMVSMGLFGIVFVSLYGGISTGMQVMQVARENLRATQIMVEKMETVRLYSWDQIMACTNIPSSFIESYCPPQLGSQGTKYYGTVTIQPVPFNTSYAADMRLVTVTLNWTNFNIPRSRSMTTFIARNGAQNYIF
jgi:prepilin-type N-terminal cleavage/methylation domain-containing protein